MQNNQNVNDVNSNDIDDFMRQLEDLRRTQEALRPLQLELMAMHQRVGQEVRRVGGWDNALHYPATESEESSSVLNIQENSLNVRQTRSQTGNGANLQYRELPKNGDRGLGR
jgi:hypothetical protein